MNRILALALVTAVACGGDDGSEYEGIYEAFIWTLNDTTCDAGGEDVLADQSSTLFYVKLENFLGAEFLNLNFCDDLPRCEELAGDASTIYLGDYGFEDGSDSTGWRSEYFSGFPNADDVCEGHYRVVTMTRDMNTLRVDIRSKEASGFAPDADGFCEDEPGRQAAEGQPCTEHEAFVAGWVLDLP